MDSGSSYRVARSGCIRNIYAVYPQWHGETYGE